MKIRWTTPAARALEEIVDHIADENAQAAYRVAGRIRTMVNRLAEHPRSGRKGRVRGTLELVIPGLPFIVPYRIKGNEVQILSVYHSSRKWPETFD